MRLPILAALTCLLLAIATPPAHAGYVDGLNTYAYYPAMHGGVDPSGMIAAARPAPVRQYRPPMQALPRPTSSIRESDLAHDPYYRGSSQELNDNLFAAQGRVTMRRMLEAKNKALPPGYIAIERAIAYDPSKPVLRDSFIRIDATDSHMQLIEDLTEASRELRKALYSYWVAKQDAAASAAPAAGGSGSARDGGNDASCPDPCEELLQFLFASASNTSAVIGEYQRLTGNTPHGYQANHLNQYGAVKPYIPKNEGFAIALQGNVFVDPNSPHRAYHTYLDNFFDQYRGHEPPEYSRFNRAIGDALRHAGCADELADAFADFAAAEWQALGHSLQDPLPNVPRRVTPRNEP